MSVEEILEEVRSLPRADQFRLVFAVQEQLTKEQQEVIRQLQSASELPIWSPYDSYEAAAELMRLRDEAANDV